jgi:proteasome lid subunit RPN8/RPN11
MVSVLEVEMVEEIAKIGRLRKPAEACGLLLPIPIKGKQIIELPNRAKKSHDTFEMLGKDMMIALEQLEPDLDKLEKMINDGGLTAWHTHPAGNVGPSKFDLKYKPPKLKSLVVTLFEDGRRPLATWY